MGIQNIKIKVSLTSRRGNQINLLFELPQCGEVSWHGLVNTFYLNKSFFKSKHRVNSKELCR